MGEGDRIQNTGPVAPPWSKEEQEAFLSFAVEKLEKLRQKAVNEAKVMDSEELSYNTGLWEGVVPESDGSVLELIFRAFPLLAEEFDLRVTQRNLGTPENLDLLTQDCGAERIAEEFRRYFAERWGRRWRVLIPPANLESISLPPVEVAPGITVEVRGMQDQEWQDFHHYGLLQHRPGDETVFFAVDLHAGDEKAALRRAQRAIEQYLAPYYLHAMRLEQEVPWYALRPERIRLLPKELVYPTDGMDGLTVQMDKDRWRKPARTLVHPERPPDDEWLSTIREIVSQWHSGDFSGDLDRHLALATKWMFSAENEEAPENAYLKHCIAWEALFPKPKEHAKLMMCLWLVILALSGQDVSSLRTVPQAERLRDRRNSLAHPKPDAGLMSTLQLDLRILKRALWSAVEHVREVRSLQRRQGARPLSWSCTLSRLVDELSRTSAKCKPSLVSPENVPPFEALGLCNSRGILTEDGQAARVEAQIIKARLLLRKDKDREQTVRWLAHAFAASMQCDLPHPRLHAALRVRECRAECPNFVDVWSRSGVQVEAPSDECLSEIIRDLHDRGIRPEAIGWR